MSGSVDLLSAEAFPYVVLLVGLGTLYTLITGAITFGLSRRTRPKPDNSFPSVTVVVCAHNEADRIGPCLEALSSQTFDDSRRQIILVDDRSTDGTGDIARSWTDRLPLTVLEVEEGMLACPKKNALALALEASTGDLILMTDADCTPAPGWVTSTVAAFGEGTGAVIGSAPLTDTGGRWTPLFVFQSMLVNALAAGSAGIGFPLACSGRNLAYRREAYLDAGGYAPIGHIVGGDDVLLMRRIRAAGWHIDYNHDPDAAVTSPVHSDRQWQRQIRYQSKARHYGGRVLSLAILVYIFHLLLLVSPVVGALEPGILPILWPVVIVKATVDGVFLWRAARRLGYRKMMRWFPLVEILTVPYVTVFCALGTLRPISWN